MSEIGEILTSYTKTGLERYSIEVRHRKLKKFQVVRDHDDTVVMKKARAKAAQWDEMWARRSATEAKKKGISDKKELAAQRTSEAQGEIERLERTLEHTLTVDDRLVWDSLKDLSVLPDPRPPKPLNPSAPTEPEISPEPEPFLFEPKLTFLDKLIRSRREGKEREAKRRFDRAHAYWEEERDSKNKALQAALKKREAEIQELERDHTRSVAQWETKRAAYLAEREEGNAKIDELKHKYEAGDPDAIVTYSEIVLNNSAYPDYLPQSFDLQFNHQTGILIVDYQLPSPDDLPTLQSVSYIQSRDEITEKHISDAHRHRLYDSLLYQISLRAIHELYEADVVDALKSVVFNGYVTSVDSSTGQETTGCLLSIQSTKDEFLQINLAAVDPKACFKKLKGLGSSKLHSLTPVAPIIALDREDRRFVASYAVGEDLTEGDNLAAMDWEDFEHLIRELFEQEFAKGGGEVKITQASRDGGVDAVVFDPDPLRGGKIIIQAKRYTNTVGVSAVRDLYGTVLNEGATKGILVTTSDYGPDAYAFAKGKPLTLLNGANLLYLLQNHGYKAKIDIKEAKRLLAESD